ncbi:DMT family transporter [Paludibacterium yongneupense]|uniref:DMT family transporter n=1 Tax=Paludibacterium yongneupense TaxID=400061 RepID=UPI0003F68CAE|nr:DMT family transporter [Paludibacterium yongneupense]
MKYDSACLPWLAGIGAALLWAGNFVVGKSLRTDIPPCSLALLRWSLAFLCLTPFVVPGLRRHFAPIWRVRGTVLVLALSGISLSNTLVYIGLGHTRAANAVVLNAAMPAFVFLLSVLSGRGRAHAGAALGMLVSLLGMGLLVAQGGGLGGAGGGDAWVAAGLFCWAIYTLVQQGLPPGLDKLTLLWILTGVGCLPLLPFAAAEHASWPAPGAGLAYGVAYLALGPSLFAMLLYNLAIRRLGALRAGQFINLVPVFGTLLSVLCLGEHVGPVGLLALVVVSCGLALGSADMGRLRRRRGTPPVVQQLTA